MKQPFQANVKQFDEAKAKQALKGCPKIVRDYVKLLVRHEQNWKDLTAKAISKLRMLTALTDWTALAAGTPADSKPRLCKGEGPDGEEYFVAEWMGHWANDKTPTRPQWICGKHQHEPRRVDAYKAIS